MTVENQNYKLEILEYAVNQCIDRLLPKSCEDALNAILDRSNEVVWRVATDIYSKSGYQIDFLFIKGILNLRTEPLQNKIIEEERIKKAKEAEKAKIEAELEAQRQVREAEEEKIRKQQVETKQKHFREFREIYPNVNIEIFAKIESIIVEQLEVDEESVTVDACLTSDLGADELDTMELMMELEGEFDIEIPDDAPILKGLVLFNLAHSATFC